ncbi:MAG: hypothetical protein AB7G11_13920 [Phycisphaerales bacterium]
MDGLTVVRAAGACGLQVRVEGDRLIVTGPKQFAAVAECLILNKTLIIAALTSAERLRWRLAWSGEVADMFRVQVAAHGAAPGSPEWLNAVCRAVRMDAAVAPSRCANGECDVIDMIIIGAVPAINFHSSTSILSRAQPSNPSRPRL